MCLRKQQSHSGVRHVTMADGEGGCAGCRGTKVVIEENAVEDELFFDPHGGTPRRSERVMMNVCREGGQGEKKKE